MSYESRSYTGIWEVAKHVMAAEAAAGPVKILTREEIAALAEQGAFTPPEMIFADHGFRRVSFPRARRCRAI